MFDFCKSLGVAVGHRSGSRLEMTKVNLYFLLSFSFLAQAVGIVGNDVIVTNSSVAVGASF